MRSLAAACDGHGSLVLISGEPGIGKTTLAGALAWPAGEAGATMIWGRCWDAGGAPAYWPWRQVVRVLAEELADAELQAAAGAGARWLVHVAPELDARLPGDAPAIPGESQQATFALFEALQAFLRACAARRPLVVALDDLHAADVASLRALDFLARSIAESAILVVATVQEVPLHRRADAVAIAETLERRAERMPLGGLDEAAIGALMAADRGAPVPDQLVRLVHGRAAGNPLFATELARLRPDEDGGGAALPGGVQAAVRDRLAALGDDGLRVLTDAAVIGQEFRILTLERVARVSRAALLDLLDEAESLGVVVLVDESGRYRFRHGLLRDTLYGSLRRVARAEAHLRVGAVLEELRQAGAADRHVSELAHHFVEAASLGDPLPAIRFSRAAGDRATAVFAFEQAADHYATALRVMELGEPDDAARGQVLLELGRAQIAAANPDGEATLLEAAALARDRGDVTLLADVALSYGPYALSPGTVDEQWTGLLEQAIAAVGTSDPARRARLLAQLGRALYFSPGHSARRLELADESIALARAAADPATLAVVLSDAHVAAWNVDRTEENLVLIAELQQLLSEQGDPRAALPSLVRSIDLHLELGDIANASIALERLEARAADLSDLRAGVIGRLHRSRQALIEGRFAEVPGRLQAALAEGASLHYSPVPVIAGGQTFCLRLLCGGLEELAPMARQAADAAPGMGVWRAALAVAQLELGHEQEARQALDRAAVDGFARVERDSFFLVSLGLWSEVAFRTGAAEYAAHLTELLEPFAGRMLATTGGAFFGPVTRTLGQAAALAGDVDGALRWLAAAREQARGMGAAPSVVLAEVDEAAVLVAAGDARATAVLDAAEAGAVALGMAPYVARVAALRERLGEATAAAVVADAPVVPSTGPARGRLVREGDTWALALDDRAVRLKDGKGVRYLAALLAHPGVELHALDLVGGGGNGGSNGNGRADADAGAAVAAGLAVRADSGDAGPLLDDAAKAAYRERITDLREAVEEAERFHDPERAAAAREELEALVAQLAGAVGLGGRDRVAGSAAERARVNVTRALRSTLKRIAEHDPALGGEIEACVRTGTLCSYEPSRLHPVVWEVG
ncbi:AAA family ATPase [Paraconexibacter antarcticus]|uniref:AAA family ATPase n=1 Tax=Paraconexibacter antarcticus TaxID=2949664 RepID=A0ABY5DTY8_9ACTN|nr:AAA family ATPase [Paraconexibacter antarcticus]